MFGSSYRTTLVLTSLPRGPAYIQSLLYHMNPAHLAVSLPGYRVGWLETQRFIYQYR